MSSALEATFALQLASLHAPGAHREYRFNDARRWRFDFAWPERMLAVEIEGGTWMRGRHTNGAGYRADCEKYNTATLAGWKVLRYTADSVNDWTAARQVAEVLK